MHKLGQVPSSGTGRLAGDTPPSLAEVLTAVPVLGELLGVSDLCALGQVDRDLRDAADSAALWRQKFLAEPHMASGRLPEPAPPTTWKQLVRGHRSHRDICRHPERFFQAEAALARAVYGAYCRDPGGPPPTAAQLPGAEAHPANVGPRRHGAVSWWRAVAATGLGVAITVFFCSDPLPPGSRFSCTGC